MSLPTTVEPGSHPSVPGLRTLNLSLRSRLIIWVLRWLLRPWTARVFRGGLERIAAAQLKLSRRPFRSRPELPMQYRVLGAVDAPVAGHLLGKLGSEQPVVLWLHGGAFVMPAMQDLHLAFLERLCTDLDASGLLPDYRLAPACPYPAGLDDCERAYRALLDTGIAPQRIVVGGESAGGNLVLGLLQRIRRRGWPMPACAVAVAPATELGRLHGPRSRSENAARDALLPMATLARVLRSYVGDHDASHPEISPVNADCRGFPPMYLVASDAEVLRDDSVLFAERASAQGASVRLDLWPALPHAFPLMEDLLPEAQSSRREIAAFMRASLAEQRVDFREQERRTPAQPVMTPLRIDAPRMA